MQDIELQTGETMQRQLSNGDWVDVRPQGVNAELRLCMVASGPNGAGELTHRHLATRDATRSEVLTVLRSGNRVRNGPGDWYANTRMKPIVATTPSAPIATTECDCGHIVPSSQVMNASMGTSCPACYDSMAN